MSNNEIEIRVTGKKDTSVEKTFDSVKKSSDDMSSGFDRAGEAADGAEGKAQGFADTLTGTTDVMAGAGQIAKGDLYGGLVTAGGGVADLAGGMASFLIPALKGMTLTSIRAKAATIAHTAATKAQTVAQRALNLVMRMNPIGLIITGIMLLVGALILAYKKSETFRRIVNSAFHAVQAGASFAFGWVKDHWPLLLAILTGPFGLAVLVIVKKRDAILGFFRGMPGKMKGLMGGVADIITAPYRVAFGAIKDLWNSTVGGFGFEIPGWVPKVGGKSFTIPEMAHGGITGGLISVGERGRELIRVPSGSTVIPNGQTERMLARGERRQSRRQEPRLTKADIEDAFFRALARLPILRLPNDGQGAYLQGGLL